MVFLYWALAFIVGAAIPQVQTISGLVAAICIMQFTYTFPPALIFGYYFLKHGRDSSTGKINWKRVRLSPFCTPLFPCPYFIPCLTSPSVYLRPLVFLPHSYRVHPVCLPFLSPLSSQSCMLIA